MWFQVLRAAQTIYKLGSCTSIVELQVIPGGVHHQSALGLRLSLPKQNAHHSRKGHVVYWQTIAIHKQRAVVADTADL